MCARQPWKGPAVMLGLLATVALTGSPAAAANGDVDVDLRAGVYMDADAPAVGGGILMSVGGGYSGWYFNPNIEFAFRDNDTEAALSGDFHYDFPTGNSISPYVGLGPSILFTDNDNDFALNVLGGIAGRRGEVRPFGQLKALIGGNDEIALMGGIRF